MEVSGAVRHILVYIYVVRQLRVKYRMWTRKVAPKLKFIIALLTGQNGPPPPKEEADRN